MLLLGACSDTSSEPVISDAGTEEDAGRSPALGEPEPLWPDAYVSISAAHNLLGNAWFVGLDGEELVDYSKNRRCMAGPMELTPSEREIREMRLADADRSELQAAFQSPSGAGFFGRDESLTEFYDAMTLPNSMTISHVRAVEAGALSFKDEPRPTNLPCDGYVSRQVLGARFAVGFTFEFASEESLQDFRDKNPGLDLEQILRSGSTSVPVAVGESTWGLKRIYVVMGRIGGTLSPDLPEVRARCNASSLRGCAQLLDELDAHAQHWLEALEPPTVQDPGPWAEVRLEVTKRAAD